MPGELFEIEGEKKKRVVRVDLYFFLLKIYPPARHGLTLPSPRTQCYFFDSDVGGFHYGPGHPYVPVLGDDSNDPK